MITYKFSFLKEKLFQLKVNKTNVFVPKKKTKKQRKKTIFLDIVSLLYRNIIFQFFLTKQINYKLNKT